DQPQQQPQSAKRPVIRIRPFSGTYGAASSSAQGIPYYPLSAGSHVSGFMGTSGSTAEPASTPSATPRILEEQAMWIKESHNMLQQQTTMMAEIQKMLKEMNAQPTREAKKAMSTISSLSALVSSTNAHASSMLSAANGASGQGTSPKEESSDMEKASGSSHGTPALPPQDTGSSLQFPRPALSISQLYNKNGGGSVAESPPDVLALPASGTSSVIKQVPTNMTASSTPQQSSNSNGTSSSGVSEKGESSQTPRTETSMAAATAAGLGLSIDGSSRKLMETQAELDELKTNVIYLIKRVNIAQILLGMLTPPRQDNGSGGGTDSEGNGTAFTMLVEDLKQLGTMSKDNLHEYMKAFVRNLEATENNRH
ncbi:hypothetical protein EV175_001263, partial [Coemansia sp. RSA 1933]